MPSSCTVTRCVDKYCQSKEVSYHKFPTDFTVLEKWRLFTGRNPNWRPSKWSSICSRHFAKECYKQYFGKRVLKHDAVPTLESGLDKSRLELPQKYVEVPVKNNIANQSVINSSPQKLIVIESRPQLKPLPLRHNSVESELTTHNTTQPIDSHNELPLNEEALIETVQLTQPVKEGIESFQVPPHATNSLPQTEISSSNPPETERLCSDPPETETENGQQYDDEEQPSLEQIIESLCRLCGGTFQAKQLVCYSSFFNLIIKCFPTLNLETYEYFPRQICTDCREKLINFSIFIDKTMSAQNYLIDRFVYNLPNPTNCFDNKQILPRIKQEPICVIKEESHKPIVHGLKDRLSFKETKSTGPGTVPNQSQTNPGKGMLKVVNMPSIQLPVRIPLSSPSLPIPQHSPKVTSVDDDIQILDPAPMKVEEIIEGEDDEDLPQPRIVEHNYSKPHYPGKIEILEERVFKTEPFWMESQICDVCGSSFDSARLLEMHKNVTHPTGNRVCSTCDLAFWSVHEYLVHKARAHTIPSFVGVSKPCIYCKKRFIRMNTRRRHMKSCRSRRILKCPSCDLTVRSTRELITHECLPGLTKKQAPEKLNPSQSSDEIIYVTEDDEDEIIFVTEDGQVIGQPLLRSEVKELSLFSEGTDKLNLLRTPEVTVTKQIVRTKPIESMVINPNQMGLNRPQTNSGSSPNSDSKTIVPCLKCGLNFTSRTLRDNHQSKHRPPSLWNAPCYHCSKIYDTRNDLEQHCKNDCPNLKHTTTYNRLKPFKCLTCYAQFSSQYSLKMHENIHTRALTYSCKYCDKTCVTKQNLMQHLDSHSEQRKHKCHLCSRTFKFPSGLRQHIKGFHLGSKPHVCSICERAYLLKTDMLRCRHSALGKQRERLGSK